MKTVKAFHCGINDCTSNGFTTAGAKRRHEKELHGPKLRCDHCGFTAKRRYQMRDHLVVAHPEEEVTNIAHTSRRRISRRSISSHSSDEETSNAQQLGNTESQHTSGDRMPLYMPETNSTQVYTAVDNNQHLMTPLYATDMSPTLSTNSPRTTVCIPHRQRQSAMHRCLRDPTIYRRNSDESLTMKGGVPFIVPAPILSSHSHPAQPTIIAQNQLNSTFAPQTLFHQEDDNHSIHYTTSSHSSPSSDQGTHYDQATVPRYFGETAPLFFGCRLPSSHH